MWDWHYVWEILPKLLTVVPITIAVTLAGFIIASVLGMPLALARRSRSRWISLPITAIADFIRKTPLIIQLYVIVFVFPEMIGVTLSPFIAGVIGLGIHYSTYMSEVYRSGIEAVPKGQWEASTALNFSKAKTWFRIILPQSIPPTIPVMGNYLIVMFKETPVLSAITLVELLMTAKELGSSSFRYLEEFTLVGIIFFALSYPSALLVRALEKRMQGRERSAATK
ncbi:ectoine/hydroxyectoine ABC transporter permease subunit EhuD [Paenibacillus camelliae]|uniref:ectoine/hydroxyectoine ABC transporter permease subunit EhuD n=1 Tax=Paenibacillus camelliae TaxID=512410 RepID=UPI0020419349|nr:ectoine/hydroxyectoine ABC transporter permease subunit EhuD [Paenibacillus camelliae]MCM3634713.1 ectoine/hydroxyectoine ABC transporter permease subunit EhuD [Paenibacillus camelliae]